MSDTVDLEESNLTEVEESFEEAYTSTDDDEDDKTEDDETEDTNDTDEGGN